MNQHRQVIADMLCELDSVPVSVRTVNGQIVVGLPNVKTGLKLLRLTAVGGSIRAGSKRLKQLLDSLGASLEVQIGGVAVASIGYGVGNAFWRILGFPPLNLKPVKVIRLVVREQRT